ncbi:outer membrane usher protein [Sulfurisoma sediminicola]|uniref:Outer membrane usher protein n=1 Tax=Sulfurisoma sediminicola TaxID=1381557 RepID=A0A497XBR5_9PROT|nr:outer membrane usher protein [Sulfurisoma sediminicola]
MLLAWLPPRPVCAQPSAAVPRSYDPKPVPGIPDVVYPEPRVPAAPAPAPAAPAKAPAAAPPAAGGAAPKEASKPASGGSVKGADRILPLEVVVNGTKSGTWVLVERAGALYAPRDAFEEWRVQVDPQAQAITFRGQEYLPMNAVPGYKSRVDFASQSLELMFSPEAFAATRLMLKPATTLSITPAEPTVFFNYDVNYQRTEAKSAPTLESAGMVGELGFSSELGILTSSMLVQNNNVVQNNQERFLRLETTLTKDFAGENKTLKVGDTATRAGLMGRSVYFGGVQFGTNFGLTPGFITNPQPILSGMSVVPSTVDLYINDVLRQTSQVPTGPFAIDNFPVLSGGGEARMVVRDLLGRESVITRSFFTSNKLLAPGLNDWSVEAGKVRRGLGSVSNDYGAGFARGIWRRGITDGLSLEGVAEATSKQRFFEIGGAAAVPGQMLASAAIADSYVKSLGHGRQWQLGLERQGLRSSIYLQAIGATAEWRPFGEEIDVTPTWRQVAANWTYSTDRLGNFGLGYASSRLFDATHIDTASANYTVQVAEHGQLMVNASRSWGHFSGTSAGLTLMFPLDNGRIVTASANKGSKQTTDYYLAATQSPTQDSGLGWRVLAGRQQNRSHEEAGLNYFGRYGQIGGDFSMSPDINVQRLYGSGGLVLTDGHLFATQRSNQSLALVEVPGYGGVGVGLGSTVMTHTDADGVALVPQLSPYQRNSVRLDPQDLPVSAELDSIEELVVPAWRTVVKVKFPVRGGRGALLRIVLDDGDVAPAGSIVAIEGDKQEFYVARRGEAFVTGLQPNNRLRLKWKDQQCEMEVVLPEGTRDNIPRIGPLPCKGVKR